MEWYEAEVRALEQHYRTLPPAAGSTVFYGSSTIRLWTTLAADLRDERAVNLGFGGATLAACAHFYDRLVSPLAPASLVLYAGDNDLGDGCSPEDVFQSFLALADRVGPNLPLGFLAIKLSPSRLGLRSRIERANRLIFEEVVRRSPHFYYVDTFHGMLAADGQPRPEFYLADGLHLSARGYREWVRILDPFRHRMFIPSSSVICEEPLSSGQDPSVGHEPRIP